MARHKVGLHKSISSILQGAPLPRKGGSGQFKAPGPNLANYVPPKPLPTGRLSPVGGNVGKGVHSMR